MTAPDPERGTSNRPGLFGRAQRGRGRLNVAFSEGRLTLDEFSTRVDQVFAVDHRRRAQRHLGRVARARPAPIPVARSDGRDFFRRRANHIVRGATPAIVCTAVWADDRPRVLLAGMGLARDRGHHPARAATTQPQPRRPAAIERGHGTPGTAAVTPKSVAWCSRPSSWTSWDRPRRRTALGDGHGGTWSIASNSSSPASLRRTRVGSSSRRGTRSRGPFAHPADGIRYACACARRSSRCRSSSGRHPYREVEGRHRDLRGIALHIGQRVSAAAAPGEILVPRRCATWPGARVSSSSIVATMSSAASRTPGACTRSRTGAGPS